jgi:hypothetical protein
VTTRTISVDVDVDLSSFSDDEISEEFFSRSLSDSESVDQADIVAMHEAFYLGRTDRAVELARKIAQDHTGRLLP